MKPRCCVIRPFYDQLQNMPVSFGIHTPTPTSIYWKWFSADMPGFSFMTYRRSGSVTAMLDQLHWASLPERRAQAKVEMMFCIVNGLVDIISFLNPTLMTRGHSQHSQRNILFHLLELSSTSTHFPQMVLGCGLLCHSSLSTAPPWTASEVRCSPSSSANCRLRFNAP